METHNPLDFPVLLKYYMCVEDFLRTQPTYEGERQIGYLLAQDDLRKCIEKICKEDECTST